MTKDVDLDGDDEWSGFRLLNATLRFGPKQEGVGPLDLDLPTGACIAVAGASGSGKSTLLHLLGLLWDGPFAGAVQYRSAGESAMDYGSLTKAGRDHLRGDRFGFVPQSAYLLPHLTCRDNVALPLLRRGVPLHQARAVADGLLRSLDTDRLNPLASAADRPARAVSGGQRQRMAIARALIHGPKVVFADEPLSGLDLFSGEAALGLLSEWRCGVEDRLLVLVSHDPARMFAWGHPDYWLLLRRGEPVEGRLWSSSELGAAERIVSLIDPRRSPAA